MIDLKKGIKNSQLNFLSLLYYNNINIIFYTFIIIFQTILFHAFSFGLFSFCVLREISFDLLPQIF